LFDLHEDVALYFFSGEGYGYPTDSFQLDLHDRQADLPKYQKANVKLVFSSVFPLLRTLDPEIAGLLSRGYGGLNSAFSSTSSSANAQHLIKIYYQLQRKFRDKIKIIEKSDDIRQVVIDPNSTKFGFLIGLEGTEAMPELSDLDIFWRLGVRSFQFTWNFDTKYASSCMSEKDYGLTGAGRKLMEMANERGIVLDLAHSGKKTCLEVLEHSELPVIISHSNSSAIFEHRRNIDNEILDALKKNGGVIGFTLIPDTFGKPTPRVRDLAEHISYVKENFGSEILAIGTDYFGLFPPDRPPLGLEDITKFENLWSQLRELGYSEDDIQLLSHKNGLRVLEKNAARWNSFC